MWQRDYHQKSSIEYSCAAFRVVALLVRMPQKCERFQLFSWLEFATPFFFSNALCAFFLSERGLAKSHHTSAIILMIESDGSVKRFNSIAFPPFSTHVGLQTALVNLRRNTPSSHPIARKVNAAAANASVPVVNVGWTTGAKNGL